MYMQMKMAYLEVLQVLDKILLKILLRGINYEMNLNPDSEFAQQQKIFRPAATYEGLAALESLGVSTSLFKCRT